MLTHEENELLTRIGPGTPAGTLLRRYWQPFCIASLLTAERPIRRVKLLGEELIVWRDPSGTSYGLVAEHCAHRGTSLAYGFVEECGIRCAYHGWKYDPQGRCLEQPFEPKGSTYKDRIRQPAYRVEKLGGFLWAYMGPEPAPLLPRWDVLVRTDGEHSLEIRPLKANWLQPMENTVDFTHTYWLHGHTMRQKGIDTPGVRYFYRPLERYGFKSYEWGIYKFWTYGGKNGESAMGIPLIFPNILRVWEDRTMSMHWRVPLDDTLTDIYRAVFVPSADGSEVEQPDEPPHRILEYADASGDYDLTTFASQDHMAWETAGRIFDRTQEHLGASDRGVVMYRRLLREQIEIVQRGGEPMALVRDPAKNVMLETLVEQKGIPEGDGENLSIIPDCAEQTD
jgi:5,5'-dehydrodivanillate O-demethylase oxygenase subunit